MKTRQVAMLVTAAIGALVLAAASAPAVAREEKPEMVTYYIGFLSRGPSWTAEKTDESRKLMEGHMAHMRRTHETGKLIVAGPIADDGNLRGILVYRTETLQEAKSLAEADPAVAAGRLKVELHPWLVQKGILPG
jgi:uncharacterized protein YciI